MNQFCASYPYQCNTGERYRQETEDRKVFVGGLARQTTDENIRQYFSQFGELASVEVKRDHNNSLPRGFGFVEFQTVEACQNALSHRYHFIMDKQVEVKPAASRDNKKVFVGGISTATTEDDLRRVFGQFGHVEDIEWPCDKLTKCRRNFAFIVYRDERSADAAAAIPRQHIGNRDCDVKKAVPQKRNYQNSMQSSRGNIGYSGNNPHPTYSVNSSVDPVAQQWYSTAWGYQLSSMSYNGSLEWMQQQQPAYYNTQLQQQYLPLQNAQVPVTSVFSNYGRIKF